MSTELLVYSESLISGEWRANESFVETEDYYYDVPSGQRFWESGNYLLIATLTGEKYEEAALLEPKGFPADASPELTRCREEWDGNGRCHSYLTLAELESIEGKAHDAARDDIRAMIMKLRDLPGDDRRIVFWLY